MPLTLLIAQSPDHLVLQSLVSHQLEDPALPTLTVLLLLIAASQALVHQSLLQDLNAIQTIQLIAKSLDRLVPPTSVSRPQTARVQPTLNALLLQTVAFRPSARERQLPEGSVILVMVLIVLFPDPSARPMSARLLRLDHALQTASVSLQDSLASPTSARPSQHQEELVMTVMLLIALSLDLSVQTTSVSL